MKTGSPKSWYTFQEEICDYFKSLGFEAETNKFVQGVRTKHDIDILVETKFIGQQLKWIVEAKQWKSSVNKLQVLGLRQIVKEIGADKGFIISEKGFQKGAIEAAHLTNVHLLTFEELKKLTKEFVEEDILDSYVERIYSIERRYWSHRKQVRKDYGLRHELGETYYSIPFVINTAQYAIKEARKRDYPIDLNTFLEERHGELVADNFQQLVNWMNLNFNVIDKKILDAEAQMQKDGTFNPDLMKEYPRFNR